MRRSGEDIAYRSFVQGVAIAEIGKPQLAGPIHLIIRAFSALPKSEERKRKPPGEAWSTVKPDFDNIAKAICDALNGIGWLDDAQVARAELTKRRCAQGDEPRVEVEFWEIQ